MSDSHGAHRQPKLRGRLLAIYSYRFVQPHQSCPPYGGTSRHRTFRDCREQGRISLLSSVNLDGRSQPAPLAHWSKVPELACGSSEGKQHVRCFPKVPKIPMYCYAVLPHSLSRSHAARPPAETGKHESRFTQSPYHRGFSYQKWTFDTPQP